MSFRLQIEATVLEYDADERERWRNGNRAGCNDHFCLTLAGTEGFGEFLVGRHFNSRGYEWIHHDFDLFGLNKPNKYPKSEDVLSHCFGAERLNAIRQSVRALHPLREPKHAAIEGPDLLIYRDNPVEVRFAEVKREDTGDELNRRQLLGFLFIGAALRSPIELFVLRERGKKGRPLTFDFTYPPEGALVSCAV